MSPHDRRKIRSLKVITAIGMAVALMFALLYGWQAQWAGFFFGRVPLDCEVDRSDNGVSHL